jgi:hypothetical protein
MPLSTTFASLSKFGFEGQSTSFPSPTGLSWFTAIDLRVNGSTATTVITNQSSGIYNGGRGESTSAPTNDRPYVSSLSQYTGAFSWYKVFADQSVGTPSSPILKTDSVGNKHILYRPTSTTVNLFKYSSTNVFVVGTSLSNVGIPLELFVDSSDDICVVSYDSSFIYITKISGTTYSVISCNTLAFTTTIRSAVMDPSDNIFVFTTLNVIKFTSSGTFLWRKAFSGTGISFTINDVNVDSTGDVYCILRQTSPSIIQKIIKLNGSTGNKIFEYNFGGSTLTIGISPSSIDKTTNNLYFSYQTTSTSYTSLINTGSSLSVVSTIQLPRTANYFTNSVVRVYQNNVYLVGSLKNIYGTRTTAGVAKIPNNLSINVNCPYNFTLTSSNGASYTYTGAIQISPATNPTIALATTISVSAAASLVAGTYAVTTASITPTSNVTVPFNFHMPLI